MGTGHHDPENMNNDKLQDFVMVSLVSCAGEVAVVYFALTKQVVLGHRRPILVCHHSTSLLGWFAAAVAPSFLLLAHLQLSCSPLCLLPSFVTSWTLSFKTLQTSHSTSLTTSVHFHASPSNFSVSPSSWSSRLAPRSGDTIEEPGHLEMRSWHTSNLQHWKQQPPQVKT